MHIKITDSYSPNDEPNEFSMRFALEDDLYDVEYGWRSYETWGCYFPIRGLSADTDKEQFKHMIDGNVWYLGQMVMTKYFTLWDNRPQYLKSLDSGSTYDEIHHETKNYIGVAACKKHNDRIDMAELTTNMNSSG